MPLIPALRRQRQHDLCKFKASLSSRASSRTARTVTQRNSASKKQNKKKEKKYQNQDKDRYLGLELEFLNLSEDIQNGITKEMGAGLNLENSEQARQEDLTSDIVCFLFLW